MQFLMPAMGIRSSLMAAKSIKSQTFKVTKSEDHKLSITVLT